MADYGEFSNPNSTKDSVHKFGKNPDVDAGGVDVWDGLTAYPFPETEQTTNIISSSVNDENPGTGAWSVRVFGLDDQFNLVSETVTLTGTTQKTLANTYYRIYRAFVANSGSGGTNAGDIDIRHGTTVIGRIRAGESQTFMCIFTIPNTYDVAYLTGISAQGLRSNTVTTTFQLQTRNVGSNAFTPKLEFTSVGGQGVIYTPPAPITVLQAGTDIRLRVVDVSATNTRVAGAFVIDMYKTPYGAI